MALFVSSTCKAGHTNKFCSSKEVNNIDCRFNNTFWKPQCKSEPLGKILNLQFLSKSRYYRFQRLYLIPEIKDWWCWMRKEIIRNFWVRMLLLVVMVNVTPQASMPRICVTSWLRLTSTTFLTLKSWTRGHVGLIPFKI